MIFNQQDFLDPKRSSVFKECRAIGGEIGPIVEILSKACEGSIASVPPLSNLVSTRPSRLPDWMRPVPPESITPIKTREVGVGIATVQSSENTTKQAAFPTTVQSPISAWSASGKKFSTTSPSPSGSSIPSGSSVPKSLSSHVDDFEAGFMPAIRLWWLCPVVGFATGSIKVFLFAVVIFLIIAFCCGIVNVLRQSKPSNISASSQNTSPTQPSHLPTVPSYFSTRPSHLPTQTIINPSVSTYPRTQNQRPVSSQPVQIYPPSSSSTSSGSVLASRIRFIYHRPSCEWANKISHRNLVTFRSVAEAKQRGYRACRMCRP